MSQLIGIFGGTFNPVHLGHKKIIDALDDCIGFYQVHWVLSARPPHKKEVNISIEHRFRMLELALQSKPKYRADNREVMRKKTSYTIDTIDEFMSEFPSHQMALIIGADSLNRLHRWHRAVELIDQIHIIALARPGYSLQLDKQLVHIGCQPLIKNSRFEKGTISLFESTDYAVSSSEIRHQLANNNHQPHQQTNHMLVHKLKSTLDEHVLDYILSKKLYIT